MASVVSSVGAKPFAVRMRNCSHAQNSGFVLLIVLVALVVVGVALTDVARHAARLSIASIEHQNHLQRKWGRVSCQRAILPLARGVFDSADRRQPGPRRFGSPSPAPTTVLRDRVRLGRWQFDLVLADESAKANLNSILRQSDADGVNAELKRLLTPTDYRTVRLRPDTRASDEGRRFGSWGQVFDLPAVARLAGDDRQVATMTRQITLFSRGPLNVLRAERPVALAVFRTVVQDGLAKRLHDQLQRSETKDLNLLLQRHVTDERDRLRLRPLLTSESESFSLWTEATSQRYRSQHFAVITTDASGLTFTREFAF